MQVSWARLLAVIAIFAPCHGQRRIQDIIQSIKASGKTRSISPSFNGERKFEIIGTGGLPLQSEGNEASPEIAARRNFLPETVERVEGEQRESAGPTIDDIITGSLSRFENDHRDNGRHKAESIPIGENGFSVHKAEGNEEEEERLQEGESSRHPNRPRRRRPQYQRRPQQGDRRKNIFHQENNGFRRPNGFQQGPSDIRRPNNFQQENSDSRRPNNFQQGNSDIRRPNNFQQDINDIRRPNNFQIENNERPQHRPRLRPNEKRPFRDSFNYVRAKRQPGSRFQGGPQRPNGPFRGNQNPPRHQQHPLKSPSLVGFTPPDEIYHGFEPYFKASTPFDEVEYSGHNEVTTPVTPESSLPEHYRPDERPGPPRPKRERRPSLNNINNLNRHVGKPRRKRPNRFSDERKRLPINNFEVEDPRNHPEEGFGVSGPQRLNEFANEGAGRPINNFESDDFSVPNPPALGGFSDEVKSLSGFANEDKPLSGFTNEVKPLSGFTNAVKPFHHEGLGTPTRTEIRVPSNVRKPEQSFSSEKKRPPGTRKPTSANKQSFGLFPGSGSLPGIENHDFKVAELSNPFEKEMSHPSQFNQHNNNNQNHDRLSQHGEDKGFFSGVPENFPKLEDFGVSWESKKIRTKRSTRRKPNNPFYYSNSNRRRRGSRSGNSRRRPTRPSHIAQDRGQTGPTGFWDDEDFDTDFFSGGGTPPYGSTPNNYSPYDFYDEYQPQPQPQPQPIASYGSRRRQQSSRRQQKPRKPQYEYEYQPEPQYEPRPTPTFYSNTRKSSPYNYNDEDNEILGSGNFEVIKGGTFYDPHDYHSAYSQYPSNSNTRRPSQGQGYGYYNKGGGDYFHNFRDFADIKGDRGDLYYK